MRKLPACPPWCLWVLGALATTPSWAQTNLVPPPALGLADDQRARDASAEAVRGGVFATPGSIVKAAAVMEHSLGNPGAVKLMNSGGNVGKGFDVMDKGTKLLEVYARGGQQGVYDSGVQMGLDEAVKLGAEQGVKYLQRRAVGAGLGAMSTAGAGIAFEAGWVAGGWARDNMEINGRKLGDHVDDFYFSITPDWAKELATGVKQVDWDSPEFQKRLDEDVERRRRQAAYNRVQRDNAQQVAQAQAHAAAMPEPAPTPSASDAWLQALNQTMAQQSQMLRSMPPSAAPRQCPLDPRTGCHPGHDEKSHPGGCKAC